MRRVAVVIACLASLFAAKTSAAATLIEGQLAGERLRLVVDRQQNMALASLGSSYRQIDMASGEVFDVIDASHPEQRELVPMVGRGRVVQTFRLAPWGPGPRIAGHVSVYHVLQVDEAICAEVLVSGWMKTYIGPVIEALEILQEHDPGLLIEGESECGVIPFSAYALEGWPLMAGLAERVTFETSHIVFSYEPDELEQPLLERAVQ